MDEKEIEQLFKKVSSHFDIVPEDAKGFFSMFIRETLTYRDELVKNGEDPLTVEEVQRALNLLEESLTNRRMSESDSARINNLVKRWISKLHECN